MEEFYTIEIRSYNYPSGEVHWTELNSNEAGDVLEFEGEDEAKDYLLERDNIFAGCRFRVMKNYRMRI